MPAAKQAALHDVGAGDELGDVGFAFQPPGGGRDPHRGVEGAQSTCRRLDLEQADVGLAVENLAVEVADLDPVTVDQPHLADPAAGQPHRRRAAEPADAEHRHLRLAEAALALRRHQARLADVAEVAKLAVEPSPLASADALVVGAVLEGLELVELGQRLADFLAAKPLLELGDGVVAVEGLEKLSLLLVRPLDPDVVSGARPQQVEIPVRGLDHFRRSFDSRPLHGCALLALVDSGGGDDVRGLPEAHLSPSPLGFLALPCRFPGRQCLRPIQRLKAFPQSTGLPENPCNFAQRA